MQIWIRVFRHCKTCLMAVAVSVNSKCARLISTDLVIVTNYHCSVRVPIGIKLNKAGIPNHLPFHTDIKLQGSQ
jgi:hypothetical protein